jgi:2-methylaconitate cis-trans-isomerase PrpF
VPHSPAARVAHPPLALSRPDSPHTDIHSAPPRDGDTIASRYFSPEKCHTTHALTGAVCVAAACNIPGSVAAQIANPDALDLHRVVIEHASGQLEAQCPIDGRTSDGLPVIASASVMTTARPLFTGRVFVREKVFADTK